MIILQMQIKFCFIMVIFLKMIINAKLKIYLNLETIHLFLQILDAGRLRDNRTDKEDEPDANYDRIPLFGVVMTSNPKVLKIEGYDNEAALRRDIEKYNRKFSREIERESEFAEYEEIDDGDTDV